MSEDRKKVIPEQLSILVDAIEKDSSMASIRGQSHKSQYLSKWQSLSQKLNSVENGAQKSVSKWQQAWRDLKSNVSKKASRTDGGNAELTYLESRVLNLKENSQTKDECSTEGIDITSIAEVDPLSSDEDFAEKTMFSPHVTVYSAKGNEIEEQERETSNSKTGTVKRQRVELFPNQNDQESHFDKWKKEMDSQLKLIIKKQSCMENILKQLLIGQNETLSRVQHSQDMLLTITEQLEKLNGRLGS